MNILKKNLPNEYQLMLGFRNGELNKTGLSPHQRDSSEVVLSLPCLNYCLAERLAGNSG